jgi:hypothetical protein
MAGCGEAWCEADIASGTPEDEARTRSAATIAAYLGEPEGGSSEGEAPAGGGEPAG